MPSSLSSTYSTLPPLSNSDHFAILLTVFPNPKLGALLFSIFPVAVYGYMTRPTSQGWMTFCLSVRIHFFLQISNPDQPSNPFFSNLLTLVFPLSSPLGPLSHLGSHTLVAKIKCRRQLDFKAKARSSTFFYSSYHALCNSITVSLCKVKSSYFHKLSISPPSKFWSFVNLLCTVSSLYLHDNNSPLTPTKPTTSIPFLLLLQHICPISEPNSSCLSLLS